MTRAIIVDIDGTVADLSHRLHHLERKDWPAFFSQMGDDSPIWATINTAYQWREAGHAVLFVSGRPEDYRETTENWLREVAWFKEYEALLMRPSGDHRPDYVVKEEILDHILGQGWEITAVFDDRPSVIDMWKRRGLHVFQVHAGIPTEVAEPRRATLHAMIGPSHGGKTTWLKENAIAAQAPRTKILESDALRLLVAGNAADQTRNDDVFKLMHTLTQAYLDAGVDVYYDATNLRRKDRVAVANLNRGGPVVYYVVDRPLETKLAHLRPGFPEAVVRKHHQQFHSQLADILKGDNLPFVTVEDHR